MTRLMGSNQEKGRLPKSLRWRERSLLPLPPLSFCTFLSHHFCCQFSLPRFKASSRLPFHLLLFSLALRVILSHPCHPHFSLVLSVHFFLFPIVFSYCSPFCCHSIFLSPSFSPPLTPPFPSHSVSHSPSRMKVMKIIGLH